MWRKRGQERRAAISYPRETLGHTALSTQAAVAEFSLMVVCFSSFPTCSPEPLESAPQRRENTWCCQATSLAVGPRLNVQGGAILQLDSFIFKDKAFPDVDIKPTGRALWAAGCCGHAWVAGGPPLPDPSGYPVIDDWNGKKSSCGWTGSGVGGKQRGLFLASVPA